MDANGFWFHSEAVAAFPMHRTMTFPTVPMREAMVVGVSDLEKSWFTIVKLKRQSSKIGGC